MKHKFAALLSLLLLASLAWGQDVPSVTTSQLILPVYSVNLTPATQANTSLVGNPGPQTIYYWMVSNFTLGSSSPVGPFVVTNAPNVLSSGNYVAFTPVYSSSVVSIDLLKTSSPSPPNGSCNCAVATAVTSGTINDQSNSTSSYTVAPIVVANYTQTLTNEVQGAGSTHLILRQNGAFVADLSTAATGGLPIGCSPGQVPSFNGTTWVCTNAGVGTVTGNGTLRTLPIWTGSGTSLGNSPLSYDGVNTLNSTAGLNISPGPNNTQAGNFNTTYTGSFCTGSGSTFVANLGLCNTVTIVSTWPAASQGNPIALSVETNSPSGAVSGTPAVTAIQGTNLFTASSGTAPWVAGLVGISQLSGSGGTATNFGGVYGQAHLGVSTTQIATNAFGVAGQINSANTGATEPSGAALIAYSPILTGIVTNIYGLHVLDQTTGGSTNNPNPHGVVTDGTAPSSFGGALTVTGALINSALTPGTSPICPNGAGGAFTTSGCTGSGPGIPLGTAGQIPVMNAGATAYAPVSLSQDCTITATGVITCTKTNNVAYGPLATQATGSLVTGLAKVTNTTGLLSTAVLGDVTALFTGTGLLRNSGAATELTQDVVTSGSNVATVKGVNAVPLCTGFSPTNGQALEYTTASAPNPCYTAATIGGGSSVPNYAQAFTSQTSITILGTSHNFGNKNLLLDCYDTASPAQHFQPASWTIDPSTYNVVINFAASQSGYCVVNGAVGGSTSTRTWLYTYQGVCQAGIASASVNFPTVNAPSYVACSGTNITPEWQIPASNTTDTFWVKLRVPTGHTGAYTLTTTYRSAAITGTATVQPTYACVAAGAVPDNPSFSNAGSTFTLTPAGTTLQNVTTTDTFTPTCADAADLYLMYTLTANSVASPINFSYVSLSVQGSL